MSRARSRRRRNSTHSTHELAVEHHAANSDFAGNVAGKTRKNPTQGADPARRADRIHTRIPAEQPRAALAAATKQARQTRDVSHGRHPQPLSPVGKNGAEPPPHGRPQTRTSRAGVDLGSELPKIDNPEKPAAIGTPAMTAHPRPRRTPRAPIPPTLIRPRRGPCKPHTHTQG